MWDHVPLTQHLLLFLRRGRCQHGCSQGLLTLDKDSRLNDKDGMLWVHRDPINYTVEGLLKCLYLTCCMGTWGWEAMCCWGLRTPAAYLYWGMVRTGAAAVVDAPAARWPRVCVAEHSKKRHQINGNSRAKMCICSKSINTHAYAGKPSCVEPGCFQWQLDGWRLKPVALARMGA